MWCVTIGTTDVIAPMLTAPKVVVLFSARVAGQTRLRSFFGRLVFERDNLFRIALFDVSFTRPVTSLAAGHLPFPATYRCELGMGGMREGFELIFVAILAGLAADIVFANVSCRLRGARLNSL